MKIKKKIVIPLVAVAVIGGAAAFFVPKMVSASSDKPVTVSATPLEKRDIANTVSVTGTVKSEDSTNVYSTLSYQVKLVNVEVGDKVNEGDVLCELDTSELIAKIDQQAASLAQRQATAQHSLAVAKNDLETEKFNQENNFDTALANAEKAVEKAKQDLESAQLTLRSTEIELSNLKKKNSEYRDDTGEDEEDLRQQIRLKEIALTKSENAVLIAEQAVEDAKESLRTAKVMNEEAIIKKEQQVTSAQLNTNLAEANMQLQELKKSLDDAIIKAPVSGTVTAVMAVEGNSGQGLLFIIEDTENLKVVTKIKEYDIASVEEGQKTKIKSDATGDDEFTGMVSKIAPTAVKDAKGETIETTDAEFEIEIGVIGASRLKIGMNARLEIVTEEKKDVFAVPFDAVVQNERGEQVVYVARPNLAAGGEIDVRINRGPGSDNNGGNVQGPQQGAGPQQIGPQQGAELPQDAAAEQSGSGNDAQNNSSNRDNKNNGSKQPEISFVAIAIPVQTGLETDFYMEISSDSLREGDLIISDPSNLTDGMAVMLGEGMMMRRSSGGQGGQRVGGPGGPGMAVRMG